MNRMNAGTIGDAAIQARWFRTLLVGAFCLLPGARTPAGRSDGTRTIFVLRDGHAAPVPVKVGLSDGTVTEVQASELHEGDPIITAQAGGAQGAQSPQPGGAGQKPSGGMSFRRGPF